MGTSTSKAPPVIVRGGVGPGLFNFGNTCYANVVLQALFHCAPFRELCSSIQDVTPSSNTENLFFTLADLFVSMAAQKRENSVSPKRFITQLRQCNEMFRSSVQHDAHELLNFLLNNFSDAEKSMRRRPDTRLVGDSLCMHEIFQGKLLYETVCLTCENTTKMEEPFFELSLDITPNSDLETCITNFLSSEVLRCRNKYFCDHCACHQEAERSLRMSHAPPVLIVHLKRFKFDDRWVAYRLPYRIPFPLNLRFPPTDDGTLYELFAIIIHIGAKTASAGHYVASVRHGDQWVLYDDQSVSEQEPDALKEYYGSDPSSTGKCGYLLFYQTVNVEARTPFPHPPPPRKEDRRPASRKGAARTCMDGGNCMDGSQVDSGEVRCNGNGNSLFKSDASSSVTGRSGKVSPGQRRKFANGRFALGGGDARRKRTMTEDSGVQRY